jgi:hypothetical protein
VECSDDAPEAGGFAGDGDVFRFFVDRDLVFLARTAHREVKAVLVVAVHGPGEGPAGETELVAGLFDLGDVASGKVGGEGAFEGVRSGLVIGDESGVVEAEGGDAEEDEVPAGDEAAVEVEVEEGGAEGASLWRWVRRSLLREGRHFFFGFGHALVSSRQRIRFREVVCLGISRPGCWLFWGEGAGKSNGVLTEFQMVAKTDVCEARLFDVGCRRRGSSD